MTTSESGEPRVGLRLDGLTLALHARVDAAGLLVLDGGQLAQMTVPMLPTAARVALVALLSLGEGEELGQGLQVRVITPQVGVEVTATVPFMFDVALTFIGGRAKITQVYEVVVPMPGEGEYRFVLSDARGVLGSTELSVAVALPA